MIIPDAQGQVGKFLTIIVFSIGMILFVDGLFFLVNAKFDKGTSQETILSVVGKGLTSGKSGILYYAIVETPIQIIWIGHSTKFYI